MKLLNITVDKLPVSCTNCFFNRSNYCCLIMLTSEEPAKYSYVKNKKTFRSTQCPLTEEKE